MSIPLRSVLPIENPSEYKLHLATWNGELHPLDVFVRDWYEWVGWSRYRSTQDDFNLPKIMALMNFYHEQDTWLFGGCFEVTARSGHFGGNSYEIQLEESSAPLVGRLKIGLKRPGRSKSFRLENQLEKMTVREILRDRYSGERFPGYEWIHLKFSHLELIIRTQRPDWKAALENIKGVYVITDQLTGKKYVGSAYGELGLWSRWACYIETGHGWNDELTKLIREQGLQYARDNFELTLIEHHSRRTDDQHVIARESFWKVALLSRGAFGYNKN